MRNIRKEIENSSNGRLFVHKASETSRRLRLKGKSSRSCVSLSQMAYQPLQNTQRGKQMSFNSSAVPSSNRAAVLKNKLFGFVMNNFQRLPQTKRSCGRFRLFQLLVHQPSLMIHPVRAPAGTRRTAMLVVFCL